MDVYIRPQAETIVAAAGKVIKKANCSGWGSKPTIFRSPNSKAQGSDQSSIFIL